jgi:ketosteroid isomerase-like protein
MDRERAKQDVEELGQQWAAAELRSDTAALDRLLADDFVGIGPLGFMLTKEQWLARFASGDIRYSAFAWEDVQVRVYGDAAIATGRQAQTGTYRGRDITAQFRATLVFVRPAGRWLLAGLQLSPIGEPPGGGQERAR